MGGESFGLENIIIHDTLDIALLKLDGAVNFTGKLHIKNSYNKIKFYVSQSMFTISETIRPICLPDNDRFDFSSPDEMFTSHCKRFFESETGGKAMNF